MKYIAAVKAIDKMKEAFNISLCDLLDVFHEIPAEDVQPAPQWICVEERLPNHYEEVLVVSKLKNIVYIAWYDADISMFMGHSHMWTTREVTCWMPLPEPPKEEA